MMLGKATLYMNEKYFYTDEIDVSIKAMKAWKEFRELVRMNSFELTREKLLKVIDDTITDIEK